MMLYLSDDELIQRFTIKAVEPNPEFYSYKNEILNRMGRGINDASYGALIDELSDIANSIVVLPEIEGFDLCDALCKKYGEIKEKILLIIAEHSSCESTTATA